MSRFSNTCHTTKKKKDHLNTSINKQKRYRHERKTSAAAKHPYSYSIHFIQNSNTHTMPFTKKKTATKTQKDEETADHEWKSKYQELVDYRNQHGHNILPCSATVPSQSKKLGKWVASQRENYRKLPKQNSTNGRFPNSRTN